MFLASKVAFSWPSVDKFGKKNLGLMNLAQIKSTPNFCLFGPQRAEKCNFWREKSQTLTPWFPALLISHPVHKSSLSFPWLLRKLTYSFRTSRSAPSAADWDNSITNSSIINTRCFKWPQRWWRRGGGALLTQTRPKSSTSFSPMKCGWNRYVLKWQHTPAVYFGKIQ